MGRRFPLADDLSIHSWHQIVSVSLLIAGMAAVIAITTALCGVKFRRRSKPKPSPPSDQLSSSPYSNYTPSENLHITSPLPLPTTPSTLRINIQRSSHHHQLQQQQAEESVKVREKEHHNNIITQDSTVPAPVKSLKETFSCKNLLTKSASTRNLMKNMSIKMQRSMSMSKKEKDQDKNNNLKRGIKLKNEDSIWTKTIILGEKCKVPDEDDEEAVIYDSKGKRICTYHPKTPKSLPVSRQNSCIDVGAIPHRQEFGDDRGD